ncbi:MAG: hypothetical protein ACOCWR_05765, partial [Oceanidesulfovibrio sp.]
NPVPPHRQNNSSPRARMRLSSPHNKALALLTILAASAVLLFAFAVLPARSKPSALHDLWSRLTDQACRNERMADDLEKEVRGMRGAIASLEQDTERFVASKSRRREILDDLGNIDASVVAFLGEVGDFGRYMGGLCEGSKSHGSMPQSPGALHETIRTFNDHIARINASRKQFFRVERRFNELLTSYTLHSESLEVPGHIEKQRGD